MKLLWIGNGPSNYICSWNANYIFIRLWISNTTTAPFPNLMPERVVCPNMIRLRTNTALNIQRLIGHFLTIFTFRPHLIQFFASFPFNQPDVVWGRWTRYKPTTKLVWYTLGLTRVSGTATRGAACIQLVVPKRYKSNSKTLPTSCQALLRDSVRNAVLSLWEKAIPYIPHPKALTSCALID